MRIAIKNVMISNMENDILIENGKILSIGKIVNDDIDVVINGEGCSAFSGIVNSYFNGDVEDCDKLLCQGITSVFDFSNNIEVTKKLVSLGLNVYSAVGDFDGNNVITETYLDEKVEEMLSAGIKAPILYVLNPNVEDETQYEELIKYGKKHNYLIATSVSENLEDVGLIDKEYGISPIALLESYGFLDYRNLLIDCVYVDKEDVNILTNYDTTICTCPTKNLINGSGIAPIYSFVKNNLNVVIGGNVKSIFQELELCKNLQSGNLNERDILSSDDVLNMANKNVKKVFNAVGELN